MAQPTGVFRKTPIHAFGKNILKMVLLASTWKAKLIMVAQKDCKGENISCCYIRHFTWFDRTQVSYIFLNFDSFFFCKDLQKIDFNTSKFFEGEDWISKATSRSKICYRVPVAEMYLEFCLWYPNHQKKKIFVTVHTTLINNVDGILLTFCISLIQHCKWYTSG